MSNRWRLARLTSALKRDINAKTRDTVMQCMAIVLKDERKGGDGVPLGCDSGCTTAKVWMSIYREDLEGFQSMFLKKQVGV